MYNVYDIHRIPGDPAHRWVADGERGRETYPATMTEDEVRTAYMKGE